MNAPAIAPGQGGSGRADNPLRMAFLKWQCRIRQIAMRDNSGRPDDGITPAVHFTGDPEPFGCIITVLNKAPGYSVTSELDHIAAKTHDPARRRDQALGFLSSTHYQRAAEFSDVLTATFPPGSPGAARLRKAGLVELKFDAFARKFNLTCKVWRLTQRNPLYRSTIAHNRLFNPALHPGAEVLGFEPDWAQCSSDPVPG